MYGKNHIQSVIYKEMLADADKIVYNNTPVVTGFLRESRMVVINKDDEGNTHLYFGYLAMYAHIVNNISKTNSGFIEKIQALLKARYPNVKIHAVTDVKMTGKDNRTRAIRQGKLDIAQLALAYTAAKNLFKLKESLNMVYTSLTDLETNIKEVGVLIEDFNKEYQKTAQMQSEHNEILYNIQSELSLWYAMNPGASYSEKLLYVDELIKDNFPKDKSILDELSKRSISDLRKMQEEDITGSEMFHDWYISRDWYGEYDKKLEALNRYETDVLIPKLDDFTKKDVSQLKGEILSIYADEGYNPLAFFPALASVDDESKTYLLKFKKDDTMNEQLTKDITDFQEEFLKNIGNIADNRKWKFMQDEYKKLVKDDTKIEILKFIQTSPSKLAEISTDNLINVIAEDPNYLNLIGSEILEANKLIEDKYGKVSKKIKKKWDKTINEL